jgi:uncharacterized protein (TIRG00374 family)
VAGRVQGDPGAPPRPAARLSGPARRAATVVGVVVTLVFAYVAVRDVDAGDMWAALREAGWWWTIPSTLLLAAAIVLRAVRWRYLFVPTTRPPLGPVLQALLVGYLFNNLLPARAGEAARVVVLRQRARVSRAESAATVVVERAFDVLSLLALLFLLVPFLPEVSWLRTAILLAVTLFLGLAAAAIVLWRFGAAPFHALARPLARRRPAWAERLEAIAENLAQGLAGVHRPRQALGGFALTTVSWIVMGLSFWALMPAFGLGLGAEAGVFVLIATGLAAILPSSPAGLGVFEAAVVVALGAYGVPSAEALSYGLVLHLVNWLPFLVAGGLALQRHVAHVRRAARAAPT